MRFRLCTPADLPRCRAMLDGAEPVPADIADSILPIWQRWLARIPNTWAIIENLERPAAERIRALGLSVFVRDDVAQAQLDVPAADFNHQLYARALAGDDAVLSEQEVAARNRPPGLYLSSVHFVTAARFESDDAQTAFQLGTLAFHALHSGYCLRSMFGVVYGPAWASALRSGGFSLQSEFPEHGHRDDAHHPYAYRIDRDERAPSMLSVMPALFNWEPPRFDFTRAQRAVLQRALLDASDVEIARDLSVSADAVKQTWRAIYRTVQRIAPELLPSDSQRAPGQRGAEKRHRLLEHLRYHPGELRPTPAATLLRE